MIRLVPHDHAWADVYEADAADILAALGRIALAVHHVGSTSIPGIAAKPVIDVLVLVERYDPEDPYRDPLEAIGLRRDHRDEAHVFFEGSSHGMRCNVHVVEASSDEADALLGFRDHLRAHPEDARRYEELKLALAAAHTDEDAYAQDKTAFVQEIVRLATSGGT